MKILHVWNLAGVPGVLAKYQRRNGHDVKVIHRQSFQEKFHWPDTDISVPGSAVRFYLMILFHARRSDIVHVHALDKAVLFLRKTYPRKKIILTYHGTDIRGRWEEKKRYWSRANAVTVSTRDLLSGKDGIIYTPNPVDTVHFSRFQPPVPASALFLRSARSQLARKIVETEAKKSGLSLIVQEHGITRFSHVNYPRFMEVFSHFFDVKEIAGKINPAMSLTGLQALAMEMKVFYLGKWLENLPKENTPVRVMEQWEEIYSES